MSCLAAESFADLAELDGSNGFVINGIVTAQAIQSAGMSAAWL